MLAFVNDAVRLANSMDTLSDLAVRVGDEGEKFGLLFSKASLSSLSTATQSTWATPPSTGSPRSSNMVVQSNNLDDYSLFTVIMSSNTAIIRPSIIYCCETWT